MMRRLKRPGCDLAPVWLMLNNGRCCIAACCLIFWCFFVQIKDDFNQSIRNDDMKKSWFMVPILLATVLVSGFLYADDGGLSVSDKAGFVEMVGVDSPAEPASVGRAFEHYDAALNEPDGVAGLYGQQVAAIAVTASDGDVSDWLHGKKSSAKVLAIDRSCIY